MIVQKGAHWAPFLLPSCMFATSIATFCPQGVAGACACSEHCRMRLDQHEFCADWLLMVSPAATRSAFKFCLLCFQPKADW